MKGYNKLRKKALEVLRTDLPDHLVYHGIDHTLNALKTSEKYIMYERIDKYESQLLRLGVLLHDIGFTVSEVEHEKHGAEIARQWMKELGFSNREMKVVEGLIMATKIPHNPQNKLEELMADIDLDYLGRKDYYNVSELLYLELKQKHAYLDKEMWIKMQIDFLERHVYFSDYAKKKRKPNKEKRIGELKEALKNKDSDLLIH